MERYNGKVAVVTGASAGIGAAIASELAKNFVTVIALARRLSKLNDLANRSEGKIVARSCDVEDYSQVDEAFRYVEENFGGVDILINNAAVAYRASLIDGEIDEYNNMVDTNIKGLCYCTRRALTSMRKRGDNGHIIHINSIAGHYTPTFKKLHIGLYAATKHAVTSLANSLRVELNAVGSKINVASISPGAVLTDMLLSLVKPEDQILESHGEPQEQNFLDPEEISDAVIYILSRRPGTEIIELTIQPNGQKYSD